MLPNHSSFQEITTSQRQREERCRQLMASWHCMILAGAAGLSRRQLGCGLPGMPLQGQARRSVLVINRALA